MALSGRAAPRVETQRLILRPHTVDDFDDEAAMWSDPEVVRYIGGTPSTREQSWARLLRYAGHWALLGYGYWAIEERETGRFVGEAGFADYHRTIDPPLEGIPEIGWALAAHASGKGFATEAVRACVFWGQEHFPPGTMLACIVAPENRASIRVAEKCGFQLVRQVEYLGQPTSVYSRCPNT